MCLSVKTGPIPADTLKWTTRDLHPMGRLQENKALEQQEKLPEEKNRLRWKRRGKKGDWREQSCFLALIWSCCATSSSLAPWLMSLGWDPPLLILLFLAFSSLLLAVPALSYLKHWVCNLAASLGVQKWVFYPWGNCFWSWQWHPLKRNHLCNPGSSRQEDSFFSFLQWPWGWEANSKNHLYIYFLKSGNWK